jgi:hypothetical protein
LPRCVQERGLAGRGLAYVSLANEHLQAFIKSELGRLGFEVQPDRSAADVVVASGGNDEVPPKPGAKVLIVGDKGTKEPEQGEVVTIKEGSPPRDIRRALRQLVETNEVAAAVASSDGNQL